MDGTNFTKTNDALNIGEIEKTNAKTFAKGEKEEKLTRKNVKFIPLPDYDVFFNSQKEYIAVDDTGKLYEDKEAIKEKLSENETRLYVFNAEGGLPHAIENKKGKIYITDDVVSSTNQLPGNKFTPAKSAAAYDIVYGANASKYNVLSDKLDDARNDINADKSIENRYREETLKNEREIKRLQKIIQEAPKMPEKPDPGKIPEEPKYEPRKIEPPKKPETPVAPNAPKNKPVEPTKPIPPFEIKNLKPFRKPVEPKREDFVKTEVGKAPTYSKVSQFLSRLILRRDSEDYRKYLAYKAKVVARDAEEQKFEKALRKYQKRNEQYKARENEIKLYEQQIADNREAYDRYMEEKKEYDAKYVEYKKEAIKYNKELDEYKAKAEIFKVDLEKYQTTAFADYMKQMDQYQKDLEEENKRSRKYDVELQFYNSAKDRYQKDIEEYALKEQNLKKEQEEYFKKNGTIEECEQKIAALKKRNEDIIINKEIHKNTVTKALEEVEELHDDFEAERADNKDNAKKIAEYRNHIEVKLEGVASLLENNEVTSDNLHANIWLHEANCKGGYLANAQDKAELLKYIASLQAEDKIRKNTNNYETRNPQAETSVLNNLNNRNAESELYNDPAMQEILKQWGNKPINPKAIARQYFQRTTKLDYEIKYNQLVDISKNLEKDFGIKKIEPDDFESFVKAATMKEILRNLKNAQFDGRIVNLVKEELDANDGNNRNNDVAQRMRKNRALYKTSFDEFLKNQKAKEESLSALSDDLKLTMGIKTDYTLTDMYNAVKATQENLLKQGKIDNKGQLVAPVKKANEIKEGPKGMGF